jgi:hypothetical protein
MHKEEMKLILPYTDILFANETVSFGGFKLLVTLKGYYKIVFKKFLLYYRRQLRFRKNKDLEQQT